MLDNWIYSIPCWICLPKVEGPGILASLGGEEKSVWKLGLSQAYQQLLLRVSTGIDELKRFTIVECDWYS